MQQATYGKTPISRTHGMYAKVLVTLFELAEGRIQQVLVAESSRGIVCFA
jgi:hypothetical protein